MSGAARSPIGRPDAPNAFALADGAHERPAPIDRVVALFAGAGLPRLAEEEDWSSSLVAVRGVAARIREMQKRAGDAVRDAQRAVRDADIAARAAEDRAQHAETSLREAITRAEQAEAQARAASERADRAEARTAEAHAWLRRMHECMVSEFGGLAGDATA